MSVYIHLGGNQIVRVSDVVAILDHNSTNPHPFLDSIRKAGRLVEIPTDEVKSYVVTPHHVYGSPISSVTLMRRAKAIGSSIKNR